MKRIVGILVGVFLGLVAMVPQVSAGLFFYPGETNEIFFNDYENLFDSTGTVKSPASTPVVGDYLAGIFRVNNITNLTGGGGSNIPDVLTFTGVFAQQITSVTPIGGGFSLTFTNPSITTFGDGLGDSFTLSDLGPTKMFALYAEPVAGGTPFTFQGTMLSNVLAATDDALLLSAGIDLPYDSSNVGFASVFAPFPPFGVATFSLSIKDNFTGLTFSPHTPVTFAGPPGELVFQSRFAPNSDPFSKWYFTSFDPAEVVPNVIPEVSSLWMLGMGLSGFGIFRRKKLLG